MSEHSHSNYKKLFGLYSAIASSTSVGNEPLYPLYFYNLIGSFFKNSIITFGITNKDLRINPVWIQTSRSGKGQLNKVQKKLADDIGMSCVIVTDITSDASLLGTIDTTAHDFNTKHGLTPENPTKTEKGKTYEFKDPIIKGDLGNYDIVIIDEGKLLVQVQSEKILTTLQPALDYPGLVRKKMAFDEPIEYECKASIIVTTIEFDEMDKKLIDQGFFMRTIPIIRKLTVEQIRSMKMRLLDCFNTKTQTDSKKYRKVFSDIMSQYDRERETVLKLSEEGITELKKQTKFYLDNIVKTKSGNELNMALSFVQTIQDLFLKIGGLVCLLDNRLEITGEDIKFAKDEGHRLARSVVNGLNVQSSSEDREKERVVRKIVLNYKKNENLPTTTELTQSIQNRLGVGSNKALKIIHTFRDNKILIQKKGNLNEKLWDID